MYDTILRIGAFLTVTIVYGQTTPFSLPHSYDHGHVELGPPWWSPLLQKSFFSSCPARGVSGRTECNLFCLDCKVDGLCSLCLADHRDHHIVQMRVGERSRKVASSSGAPQRKRRRTVASLEVQAEGDVVLEKTPESCMGSSRSCKANVIGADLLAEVFSRLPFEERMRTVPLVCKAWRSASCDPTCWRIVDMEGWFEKRVQEDISWEFECEPRVEFLVKKIVDRSSGQLKELRTMHCSDGAIEYIADRCPLLTVLSIRNSPLVTDKSTSKLAASCPKIQELDVSDCYNISNQALEALRRWKPLKLQIKPLVLYFFWQHMLRIYMSSCKLQS